MRNKARGKKRKLGNIFSPIFSSVEESCLTNIANEYRCEEDHITGDVLTKFEERINNQDFNGIKVSTKQFTGRGPNSDESITGADGALILDTPYLESRKFYLFQAKKFKDVKGKFDERAISQKWKMLTHTSDSFFLIYTPKRFYYVSAFMVGLNDTLASLPKKSFHEFHKDFFNCFIGDHSLVFPWFPTHIPRHIAWDFLEDFSKNPSKFDAKNPLAKNNLVIQIQESN